MTAEWITHCGLVENLWKLRLLTFRKIPSTSPTWHRSTQEDNDVITTDCWKAKHPNPLLTEHLWTGIEWRPHLEGGSQGFRRLLLPGGGLLNHGYRFIKNRLKGPKLICTDFDLKCVLQIVLRKIRIIPPLQKLSKNPFLVQLLSLKSVIPYNTMMCGMGVKTSVTAHFGPVVALRELQAYDWWQDL